MARSASSGRALKYFAFIAVLIALVVVPFLLFGAELEAWSLRIMADDRSKFAVATAGGLLLASDVVLPIPSTVVISGLGALLGGALGLAVAVVGLTLGCVLGYGLDAPSVTCASLAKRISPISRACSTGTARRSWRFADRCRCWRKRR